MMNTRENNDIIDHIGVIYAKNDIELSWLIELSGDCNENQITQWRTNLIGSVYTENDTKLLWPSKLGVNYDEK